MPQSGPGASVRPSCHAPVVPVDDDRAGEKATDRTPVWFCTPRRVGGLAARLAGASAVVLVGLLGLCGSAFAAVENPEKPVAQAATEVHAGFAVLHGMLDPGKTGEPGSFEIDSYEFVYRASTKGECEGAGQQATPVGMSLGGGKEQVPPEFISGLSSGTEYAVCLVVRNGATPTPETAISTPVSFTTTVPPEAPSGEEALEVTASTAKLKGILNPTSTDEAGTYEFFHAAGTECEGSGAQASPEPAGTMTGVQGQTVTVTLTGLLPGTSYTYCLAATNSVGETTAGTQLTFETEPAAPTVSEAAAPSVAASTATITAEINPSGLASSYHAEYVSEAQYNAHEWAEATKVPNPDAELPASNTPIPVSEHIASLEAGTTYHIRYTATNTLGTTPGAATTLTTPTTTTTLPDNRVDELVSNTGNEGELYTPPSPFGNYHNTGLIGTGPPFQVADNGESVAYVGEPSYIDGNGSVGSGNGNQWLAKRTTSGWVAEDISPTVNLDGYQAFSSDLSTGIIFGEDKPQLTPEVSPGCEPLYTRASASGQLTPLVTAGMISSECGRPLFAGASEGDAQIIFQSEAALTPNAQEATEAPPGHEEHSNEVYGSTCMFGCNLYDSAGGHLTLVNTLEGRDVPDATFGGYAGEHRPTDFSNDISRDGSRVFWTDTQEGPDVDHVFVLENGTTTVQVSGAGAAEYWTATPDGHYAYYTEGGGLWRFDTQTNTREELAGSGAGVEGIIGASEDGAYLYFVADGALAPGATPRSCVQPITEENDAQEEENAVGCNLYVIHDGTPVFIATLAPQDNHIEGSSSVSDAGDWWAYAGKRLAEVTPDGRHLAFQSRRRLTGYDNEQVDRGSHYRLVEAFVYSAADSSLACASCVPSGGPSGVEEGNYTKLTESESNATYTPRWISANGNRLFFMSWQSLAPADTNGVQDVYEWEREGEGSCSVQTPVRRDGGCDFLLSGGVSDNPSFLVGTDPTGTNVLFEHVGPLGGVVAPGDQNELYDARIEGGFPHTSLACSGTGCQGVPPAPPSFATPASVTFSGGGNFGPTVVTTQRKAKTAAQIRSERLAVALKACRHHRVRSRRVKCERQARAKYAAGKPRRAKKAGTAGRPGNDRRAGA
jgi:hypothetical protein